MNTLALHFRMWVKWSVHSPRSASSVHWSKVMLCGGDVLQSFNDTKKTGERLWTDKEIEAEQCKLQRLSTIERYWCCGEYAIFDVYGDKWWQFVSFGVKCCEGSTWPTWCCLCWTKRSRSWSMGSTPRQQKFTRLTKIIFIAASWDSRISWGAWVSSPEDASWQLILCQATCAFRCSCLWPLKTAAKTHGKRWWTKVNNRCDGVIHMMVCIFKMYHTSGHVFRLQTASTWGISSSVVRAHLASNESIRYLVHDKADFASVASLSSHGPARRARQGKRGETRLAKLSLSLLFSALPQVRDYILDHKLNELPNWQWALDLCPEIKFKAFDFWNQQECCLCAHLFSWWRLVKFWQNVTMENDIVFHHPVVKVTAKDVFQLPEPCWAMLDGQMTAEKCSAQDAARPDWWDQIAIVGDPISEVAGAAQRLSGDSQVRNLRHGTQDAACTVVVHSCTLYITVHHCTSLYITVHHCISLYITVHHCTSLYITVHHCTSLYITVHHCTSLYITVHHCTSLYITVHHCTSLYITLHHCTSLYITVHHCTSLYITVYHCTSLYITLHHCISLYITVHHCTSLYITVYHCTSLYITVHHCTSLYITVHHCTSLYITAHHCTSLYITVHHCTSLYITVHHCTSLYITVHHCTSLYITVRHCTSLYITVHHCTSLYITVHHCTSVLNWCLSDVCRLCRGGIAPGTLWRKSSNSEELSRCWMLEAWWRELCHMSPSLNWLHQCCPGGSGAFSYVFTEAME